MAEEDNPQTEEDEAKQPRINKEYQYAKYNVQVEVPTYDDDLYRSQLQDTDWTKEETDYLVNTIKDFGQKWPVVVDRYDFHPTKSENGSSMQPKERSMEDLKHRYYNISAKILAHSTPISSMNAQQYTLYSNLQAFNPAHEKQRKSLVNGHITRQQDEVNEETVLLAELQRIMINQQQLENERRDIRERLEFPISTSNASNAQYSSSAALGTLFQQLLQADRMKKDRKFKNVPDMPNNPTPSSAQGGPSSAVTASGAHRDSITSTTQPARKGGRDSLAGPNSDGTRPLNAQSEQRYFITHHDRLSSGVSFASDKLHKPRNAKSAIQSERIAAVLAHLQIPEIIPVPTQKVVEDFERLMQKVTALLDMRKVAEKEEHEIRVRNAEKGIKGEKDAGAGVSVKEERRMSAVAAQEHGAAGTGQTAGQKRSASVMSESVGNEQQSSKRPKM